MTRLFKRIFGSSMAPATHNSVVAAERDHGKERVIQEHRARTAEAIVAGERTSFEIRQRLAGNVLSIVSGDRI